MKLRHATLAALAALGACDDGGGGGNPTTTSTATTTSETDTSPDTSEPTCTSDDQCTFDGTRPLCDTATSACVGFPRGKLIGWRDGAAGSVDVVELYRPNDPMEAPDLDFHPDRGELWVLHRPIDEFDEDELCSDSNPSPRRCEWLQTQTTIIFEPGTPNQQEEAIIDANSWHFMRRSPGIAFGALDTFATCPEFDTGNYEDEPGAQPAPPDYIGPSLWSADLEIYNGSHGPGGNGSHLDMLHETPWCMGIAHERDNVYWLFNGKYGSVDRVDFHEPHEPGGDDHSDGEVHRYLNGFLTREPGVPSGMAFRESDAGLYIADTGAGQILKLDTTSGTRTGSLQEVFEELQAQGRMNDAVSAIIVPPGTVEKPSGLAIHDDVLYVTDNATSKMYAFDMENGAKLRELTIDVPAGSLAGITVGPDDKLYFGDLKTGAVFRIDPK